MKFERIYPYARFEKTVPLFSEQSYNNNYKITITISKRKSENASIFNKYICFLYQSMAYSMNSLNFSLIFDPKFF